MAVEKSKFRVVIFYGEPDRAKAEKARALLRRHGIDAWLASRDLRAGEKWFDRIRNVLVGANRVLILVSSRTVSRDGELQHEIRDVMKLEQKKAPDGRFVLPGRLDDCEMHPLLNEFHWIDLITSGDWARLPAEVREQEGSSSVQPDPDKPARSRRGSSSRKGRARSGKQPPAREALPLLCFPDQVEQFLTDNTSAVERRAIPDDQRNFAARLGARFDPVSQLAPAEGQSRVHGFDCRVLGPHGETFHAALQRLRAVKPALARCLMAISIVESIEAFRSRAEARRIPGVRELSFSLVLDEEMLDSEYLESFLSAYRQRLGKHLVFEVNALAARKCLVKLKRLRKAFKLQFTVTGLSKWDDESISAELGREVTMSKMQFEAFRRTMSRRDGDSEGAISHISSYRMANTVFAVVGVERDEDILFLEQNWPAAKCGTLFGQGYKIDCGMPWTVTVKQLKDYGYRPGAFLPDRSP
jgi:hypothetical protein